MRDRQKERDIEIYSEREREHTIQCSSQLPSPPSFDRHFSLQSCIHFLLLFYISFSQSRVHMCLSRGGPKIVASVCRSNWRSRFLSLGALCTMVPWRHVPWWQINLGSQQPGVPPELVQSSVTFSLSLALALACSCSFSFSIHTLSLIACIS